MAAAMLSAAALLINQAKSPHSNSFSAPKLFFLFRATFSEKWRSHTKRQ